MDFFEVVKRRRPIHAFGDQAVEEEKPRVILETISVEPSDGNLQAFEVYVIRDARRRTELVNATLGQGSWPSRRPCWCSVRIPGGPRSGTRSEADGGTRGQSPGEPNRRNLEDMVHRAS